MHQKIRARRHKAKCGKKPSLICQSVKWLVVGDITEIWLPVQVEYFVHHNQTKLANLLASYLLDYGGVKCNWLPAFLYCWNLKCQELYFTTHKRLQKTVFICKNDWHLFSRFLKRESNWWMAVKWMAICISSVHFALILYVLFLTRINIPCALTIFLW